MPVLKNVKAQWSKLGRPEKKYRSNDTQWSINALCSEKQSKGWVKKGFATKERTTKEGDPFIFLALPTHKQDGSENKPVKVVDKFGMDVDPNKIGNGSVLNIAFRTYDWEYAGDKGTKAVMTAVQVVELVEYEGGSSGIDEFEFAELEEVDIKDEVADDDLDLDDEDFM